MKLRPLVLTVAVLAVLSAVVYYIRRPAPPASADPRLDQPMLASATIEKAAKVHLSDQGKTVDLARQPDGTWRVTSYYDLPADLEKLSGFLGSFTEAKLQRVITNPERVARLEFKDSAVTLSDSAGKDLWSVTLGKNADAGGRFVRFGGETKAYLTNLNAWLDVEPKSWASTELLKLKADDVAKLEIPFDGGHTVTVSRDKKESAWAAATTPRGQKLNDGKIASVVTSLATLRFSDTADPTDPKVADAKAHERTVTLTTFGGQTFTIALGRKPEEKKPKPAAEKKTDEAHAANATASAAADKTPPPAKPSAPEFETIPAGPVFAFITSSDASAPINAMMQKRAFEISDYTFTELPEKAADLFEPLPAPKAPPAALAKPTQPAKTAAPAQPSTASDSSAASGQSPVDSTTAPAPKH